MNEDLCVVRLPQRVQQAGEKAAVRPSDPQFGGAMSPLASVLIPPALDKGQISMTYGPGGTLSERNREIIVEYVCEVCEYFGSHAETSWASMNYFDRYLCSSAAGSKIDTNKVEVIALSCVIFASKFLEMTVPALNDICAIVSHRCTAEHFKESELSILAHLDWQLHVPTPHSFVARLLSWSGSQTASQSELAFLNRLMRHCHIFISLSAYQVEFVHRSSNEIGAASLICAYRQLELGVPEMLRDAESFAVHRLCQEEVENCADSLLKLRQDYGSAIEFPPELLRFSCSAAPATSPNSVTVPDHGELKRPVATHPSSKH